MVAKVDPAPWIGQEWEGEGGGGRGVARGYRRTVYLPMAIVYVG